MSETRKLAAILVADVAGYSRLMGEDEAGTARAVRERREGAAPIIRAFGGRLVKTMGDGVLLEFPSVVAAAECAILIQKMMAERNSDLPENKRFHYRIGVNLGDVLIEGDDILGDGVNLAARLESICEPGGVCISGSAYEHIHGRVAAAFTDLGEQRLKNIARALRAYALSPQAIEAAKVEPPDASASQGDLSAWDNGNATKAAAPKKPAARAPLAVGVAALVALVAAGAWYYAANRPAAVAPNAAAPAEPAQAKHLSIVVLPFTNLSGDPSQDYFSDGITENLTTELSRIHGSFVIARNTAFTYKGKSIDAKAIGKELGVRYVLEGSAQREGARVRVNAQLIDAETSAHLWADRFEEDLADLFKLQDEVVARLANRLGYELVKAEADRGARSKNPDAIDLTMRGQALLATGWRSDEDKINNDNARAFFERALKIDPDNADAIVGKAIRSSTWMDELRTGLRGKDTRPDRPGHSARPR
jgi:adenylate cyclase